MFPRILVFEQNCQTSELLGGDLIEIVFSAWAGSKQILKFRHYQLLSKTLDEEHWNPIVTLLDIPQLDQK